MKFLFHFTSNRFDILTYITIFSKVIDANSINIPKNKSKIHNFVNYYRISQAIEQHNANKKKGKNGINHKPIYSLTHFFRKKEKFRNLWGNAANHPRRKEEERKARFGRKWGRLNGTVKPVNSGQGLITWLRNCLPSPTITLPQPVAAGKPPADSPLAAWSSPWTSSCKERTLLTRINSFDHEFLSVH